MTRSTILGSGLVLAILTACASDHADVEQQLRRIQAQEVEARKIRESGASDPLTEPLQVRLENEVQDATNRLVGAGQGGDVKEITAASSALDSAKARLAAEVDRQKKLEELRARTPRKLIRLDSIAASSPAAVSRTDSVTVASKPATSASIPVPVKTWFSSGAAAVTADTASAAPLSRPRSRPASAPDTRPAASADETAEFERLDERIRWLADLRNSAGDRAGSSRVKRDLIHLTDDFRNKDRVKALEGLRKLEREADH